MIFQLRKKQDGFTIVELLIVIVVIAILAAVTIVAFNGISERARQSAMQANIKQLKTQLANYKTLNGDYPVSLDTINNGQGPTLPSDMRYLYTIEGTDYCATIVSSQTTSTYNTCGNSATIASGTYPTHTGMVAGYPTRDGYTNMTGVYGVLPDSNLADIGSIPVGSWMIVVLSYTAVGSPTPPAGWVVIAPVKTTGTMQTIAYAKVKQSGDAANQEFDAVGSNGSQLTNGVLLWGRNAAPISSWITGAYGDRANNATATTTVTPTINVTTAHSLVLSIATERTTATETNYTSLTGANPWIWIPQPDSLKLQTITIGYNEQANTGTSQAMTVTYPNSQAINGTGIQIAIPPAS